MKRAIEDSNDSDTMNMTAVTQNQIHYQQQQQQQQQQFNNSSSPLSNSSSNSSSCLTNASFSSTSSFSPLQLGGPHQQIIYAGLPQNAADLASLTHHHHHSNPIILTLPVSNQVQTQHLVALNNANTTNSNSNSVNTTNGIINSVIQSSDPNGNNSVNNNNTSNANTTVISSYSPSIYSYNSSSTTKPEAKKVKTQKTQPSKVVHIRNIPQQITEIEIIQFGLIFGNIINVLNLRSKCQAFLEFEKCEEAQSMINFFANNPISVAGRQIFVQYSNYKNLVTDPSNTNNQVAKAALDLAKDLHKAAQTGGQNTVLRAMIQNMVYGVTLDTIYAIFNRYGSVLKIITFTKNDKFQALIQMKDAASAQAAKNTLHGQNIYNACCTLHIDYSKLNTLNVKYNNEKSRDYTNPLLPAGDCPDHLALGPGGFAGPIQLSMAAAAAAAAASGYGTQFTTSIPAGYHLAPAGNPFLPFTGKFLPQQTIINATSLLQPTPNSSLASATNLAHTQNTPVTNHSAATAAALAAAYGLNQANVQSTNSHANNLVNSASQNSLVNGTNGNLTANSHQAGSMLFPFLQNLNEENGYIMMYTTT